MVMIQNLKKLIKQLELDNRKLRKQFEAAYGMVVDGL